MTARLRTFQPLVHACLDLLIEREKGIWHLSNAEPNRWADLARRASEAAGVDASRLDPPPQSRLGYVAPHPRYNALQSEKAFLLPKLDDALVCYLRLERGADPLEHGAPAARG